ncbi:transposase [Mycobacterium phage Omega]|uniref:Uncharacterized protein n=1 Tax=Mycobacterium phage Omega TaxID=2907835 RepID=Q854P3_BPMOM|nr:transposase [Mycobacterium phage Omega]AAN12665.1 hypothetical protein PBI_OMEGA_21 [Mycobacterium phage Omega]
MKPFSTTNIGILAELLDDIEDIRIAAENRLRSLTDTENNGYGLREDDPTVIQVRAHVEQLQEREKSMIKNLERSVKAHPLGDWITAQKGIGYKQAGRLLAKTGDPYWHSGFYETGEKDKNGDPVMVPYDRPRTVSELWAYCGYHVVNGAAPRHMKGVQGNWNDVARMRLWNITGACLKAQGHYADVYYAAKEQYANAVHGKDCVRCGPKGKPALAGSPLSDGHKHARALRKMGKEILRDLWRESKRLHEAVELPQAA